MCFNVILSFSNSKWIYCFKTQAHTFFNFYYYYYNIPFDDDVVEYMMVTNRLGYIKASFIFDNSIDENV